MSKKIRQVYLDHNATTPLHPEVKKTLAKTFDMFGNPSSLHQYGRVARQAVEEARESIAAFINAKPHEIIFAGSGSEANNTVINLFSCAAQKHCEGVCPASCRTELITTKIEHPCVLESAKCFAERGGIVKYIGVDSTGKIDMTSYKSLLGKKTGLVSVMMANNEIGTMQDVVKIAKMAHDAGAMFHTDAIQAVGKIPVDVREMGIDYLSFSAHKIYGPKGIGVLYVKSGLPFCPFIRGGHQETGRRAGTENTLGIIGFAKAIELRRIEMADEAHRLLKLKKLLRRGIEENIPGVYFNGHPTDSLPGTLNASFAGAEGESILLYLDLEGIAVSTGSACASGSLDPSHVLVATGLTPECMHGAIRMSMGRDTTEADVKYIIETMTNVVAKVRKISSFKKGVSS